MIKNVYPVAYFIFFITVTAQAMDKKNTSGPHEKHEIKNKRKPRSCSLPDAHPEKIHTPLQRTKKTLTAPTLEDEKPEIAPTLEDEKPEIHRPRSKVSLGRRLTASLSPQPKKPHIQLLISSDSTKSSPRKTPKTSPKKPYNFTKLIASITKDPNALSPLLQQFLNDEECNPNQQDENGNTLLHHAILKKHEPLARALIQKAAVYSLIKNHSGSIPHNFLCEKLIIQYQKLYHELSSRCLIDHIVNAMILTDPTLSAINLTSQAIEKKISDPYDRIQNIVSEYATIKFMSEMIRYRIEHLTISYIEHIITAQQENPNAQDDLGNTPLHHAAYLLDKKKLVKLLHNPHVNSLIKNYDDKDAHQVLPTNKANTIAEELRLLIFPRNSLDRWIQKKIPELFIINPLVKNYTPSDDLFFDEIIEEIIATSTNIDSAQIEDRALPKETVYPDYADKNFLREAFIARMKEIKPKNETPMIKSLSKSESRSSSESPIETLITLT